MLKKLFDKAKSLVKRKPLDPLDPKNISTTNPYGKHLGTVCIPQSADVIVTISEESFSKGTLLTVVCGEKRIYSKFFPKK